jgi:hypothetical protein
MSHLDAHIDLANDPTGPVPVVDGRDDGRV